VGRMMKECGWKQLKDITPESFQTWRAKQTLSPKTLNEYLGSISSLLNWMEKHERIPRNPLQHVQKVQANGRQVRPRRAFTDDEMQRLLGVAGKRKVVYLTAVYTGLRRSELAALEWPDLHLVGEKPFINVRASTTKNHQQAVIALHPELVSEMRDHVAKMPTETPRVFAGVMPTMTRFKMDLKAAGIPFLNTAGQRADFHSLRYTLATNLARAGTAPRVAMEIMRHSDMRLTAKTYTDAGLLPVADAVLKLPFLTKPKDTSTQIGTQDLFREGHDLSATGTTVAGIPLLDLSGNEQLGREKESPVQTGQNLEIVRGTGFEPVTSTVSV
jgi:integrase